MSEKLSLKWNDFQENVNSVFAQLRGNSDFSDVTLACEDGQQFEAHKVILAASSPFFHNLLKMNKHTHPLIYMRGIKSEDLDAIMDFLYCGEAKVFQGNLDSFLAIAEELQLKGLMGKSDMDEEWTFEMAGPNKVKKEIQNQKKLKPVHKKESDVLKTVANFGEQIAKNASELNSVGGTEVALTNLEDLDAKCNAMMEATSGRSARGQLLYQCKVCGKEEINCGMKNHIETNHLEGISIPCKLCENTFKCRNSLAKHTSDKHTQT